MPAEQSIELGVSDFVALLNQTLEFAYPGVIITGELANLRVSKNRWLYFDLKDELATVRFFGTVYQLPGPLEDGMLLKVKGQPRLHPLYGFSVNIQHIQPAGEGSLRRAAELLKAKLAAEGLFDPERKRLLPYPPQHIGLVASRQSAAYADFIKVLGARWGGLSIDLIDVQVQGELAPAQIAGAIRQFNEMAAPPEVIVLIRGGGSPEDLAAFNTEVVTRAVAGSRVPTLVAVGHESDVSLAELAADQRASTPSNAAELLVPDRTQLRAELKSSAAHLRTLGQQRLADERQHLSRCVQQLDRAVEHDLQRSRTGLEHHAALLAALSPTAVLRRGYAIVRKQGKALRSVAGLKPAAIVDIQLADGRFSAVTKETHG